MLNHSSYILTQPIENTVTIPYFEELLPKTFNLNISASKYANLVEVLQAQCLATKNLTNTASFIIKNIQSSYVYENDKYYLKAKLHINQIDILDFVNTHISYFKDYKESLKAKKLKAIEEEKIDVSDTNKDLIENKDISTVKHKSEVKFFEDKIDKDTYYQILDKTFLQFIVELYSKAQSLNIHTKNSQKTKTLMASDYEVCSSAMRQLAIHGAVDNYQNYFKAVSDYFKNPSKYKGMPQSPKYLAKRQGKTIDIAGASIPANGHFVKMKSGQYLFTDYDKTTLLTEAQLSAYKEFSFNELLNQVKVRGDIKDTEKPVLMRIVPHGKRIKVEVVFNTVIKTPTQSALGKMISLAKEDLYKEKTGNILEIKNKDLVSLFKDKFLSKYDINTLNIVGVDLGITNIAGIAYHTQTPTKGKIISNKEYEKRIKAFDRKIDNCKIGLSNKPVNAVLEKNIANRPLKLALKKQLSEFDKIHKDSTLSQIEIDKSRNEIIRNNPITKLTKSEIEILRLYNKTIYENTKLRQLLLDKSNFVTDCVHKLSHAMVQDFVKHNIEIVFIGKNDGWKQKSNMGKTMNRRFYNIPHAKLIQQLRYKCYEKGILVLTTEESYTSKTSFINNSILKEFGDRNKNIEEKTEIETATIINLEANNPENIPVSVKEKHNYGGKRDTKNRHNYINNIKTQSTALSLNNTEIGRIENNKINNTTDLKNSIENIENGQPTPQNGDKVKIHAEHNGAYNIIRKADVNFKYDKTRHSRKNNIYTMFGKQSGLTKIKTKFKVRVAPKAHVGVEFVNA